MWDGFNKRKFPRINLRCDVFVQAGDQNSPIVAQTQNVGIGGICVVLDQELDKLIPCKVRLELEEKLPKIECLGKVAWVVPTRELKAPKSRFDTGIEFVDLDPEIQKRLEKFLQEQPSAKA